MQTKAVITGVGSYVPQKTIDNDDLEKLVETSDEWIMQRTGIKTRHIVDDNEFTSDLGYNAAKAALENAKLSPEDIDLIILATVTPDNLVPNASSMIQYKLGAVNATAIDINVACPGFIFALSIAEQYIENGFYKNVIVIGGETLSRIVDWKDRKTCILFGDGAGAVVLSAQEGEYGILKSILGTDGSAGGAITCLNFNKSKEEMEKRVSGIPSTLWMNGGEVLKFAVRVMVSASEAVVEKAGLTMDDIALLIPHQANLRIIESAVKRLKIPNEKVMFNIENYGNMSAASIPIALDEAYKTGRIKTGDNILLVAFGGGLTWGSMIIKWK